MLTDIYDEIYDAIKSMPDFNNSGKVGRYHGEFEEGFEWVPVLPAALLVINNSRPVIKNSDASALRTITQVTIFVADRDDSLQLAEDVADVLDGADFEIDQAVYFMTYKSLEFYGYIKQVEIYKIIIEVK